MNDLVKNLENGSVADALLSSDKVQFGALPAHDAGPLEQNIHNALKIVRDRKRTAAVLTLCESVAYNIKTAEKLDMEISDIEYGYVPRHVKRKAIAVHWQSVERDLDKIKSLAAVKCDVSFDSILTTGVLSSTAVKDVIASQLTDMNSQMSSLTDALDGVQTGLDNVASVLDGQITQQQEEDADADDDDDSASDIDLEHTSK
jgi:mannose/fructose/N-acetylgalactosamine-specific phosphotransferase system component IIB